MLARERFAWVQLTALVLIFGVYFPVFSMMQGWQPGPTASMTWTWCAQAG